MKKVMMGTEAATMAVKLARVQVVSAYPITPQTVIVESLADIIGRGELKAKYMPVESEHTAMSSCMGASLAGARTFTATSSQGLAYMHEMLHFTAGERVPVVMVNCNRAMAPPWNLYCDHTDSLSQRDTGWIQYYCADAQDVLDAILIAYAVAEQALLPVMINLDAFYLTHTSEPLDVPDQETVDLFLPPYQASHKLDVDDPKTFSIVCGADLFSSIKYKRQCDTLAVARLWDQVAEKYNSHFNRLHQDRGSVSNGGCRPVHRRHRYGHRHHSAGGRPVAGRGIKGRQPAACDDPALSPGRVAKGDCKGQTCDRHRSGCLFRG